METVRLIQASATSLPLEDASVHLVVTSPPYWGLRSYKGDQAQDWADGWRGGLGHEPTIEMYVQHIVQCFREVKRVLRDDGVCFIDLGDAYYGNGRGGGGSYAKDGATRSEGVNPCGLVYDTSGKAPEDCPLRDSIWNHPCDGCQAVSILRTFHKAQCPSDAVGPNQERMESESVRFPMSHSSRQKQTRQSSSAIQDSLHSEVPAGVPPLSSQVSKRLLSSQQRLAKNRPLDNSSSSQDGTIVPSPESQECEHKKASPSVPNSSFSELRGQQKCICDKAVIDDGARHHTGDKSDVVQEPYPYYTTSSHHLRPGSLCGIPWRVALALQDDGWTLRSAIIWAKAREDPEQEYGDGPGSTMPESLNGWRWERHRVKVKAGPAVDHDQDAKLMRRSNTGTLALAEYADCPGCKTCSPNDGLVLRKGSWRPTEAHEYILMLTKGMGYFSDREAVAEPASEGTNSKGTRHRTPKEVPFGERIANNDSYAPAIWDRVSTRNLRDVWVLKGGERGGFAHYATFPLSLPTRCILAGTPEKVCSVCGAPWARVVEHSNMVIAHTDWGERAGNRTASSGTMVTPASTCTLGWRRTCEHAEAPTAPALVLDPFVGTGTTCIAALRLGRRSIGVDISEEYLAMARKRLEAENLPLEAQP